MIKFYYIILTQSTIEIKHSGAIVNRAGSASSSLNNQNINRIKQPIQTNSINSNKPYNFENPRPKAPVVERSIK
jgi:hypothetical protein